MKVEVKKISLENYKKFPSKSVDLFPRTEISGRNREGKSTLQDAYLDVLTGKMANGTEPTSIRRKENGVEVPKVDVIRELTLVIDGKEKVIRKITKQKWRKPRWQQPVTTACCACGRKTPGCRKRSRRCVWSAAPNAASSSGKA